MDSFPCLNSLDVKEKKGLVLCPMQDIVFFPFLNSAFGLVNSGLFHAGCVTPLCLPHLHLHFPLSTSFLLLSTLFLSLFPTIHFVPIVERVCKLYQPVSSDSGGAGKEGYTVSAP